MALADGAAVPEAAEADAAEVCAADAEAMADIGATSEPSALDASLRNESSRGSLLG